MHSDENSDTLTLRCIIDCSAIQHINNCTTYPSRLEFNNCPTICDLFSLLHFCRQLYIFRVLTPIIRSSYNCNYSFWYWLTGSTTIRSRERMVVDPVSNYSCNYSCTSSWWWVSTPETCIAAYRNVINWISRILLDSYWCRIHLWFRYVGGFVRQVDDVTAQPFQRTVTPARATR